MLISAVYIAARAVCKELEKQLICQDQSAKCVLTEQFCCTARMILYVKQCKKYHIKDQRNKI